MLNDPHIVMVEHLESIPDFTTWQVAAGRDRPPADWKPSEKPLLLFKIRGGDPTLEGDHWKVSFQFQIYGESEQEAFAHYRQLHNALQNSRPGGGYCRAEFIGESLTDPETHWPFVLAFFQTWIRAD